MVQTLISVDDVEKMSTLIQEFKAVSRTYEMFTHMSGAQLRLAHYSPVEIKLGDSILEAIKLTCLRHLARQLTDIQAELYKLNVHVDMPEDAEK